MRYNPIVNSFVSGEWSDKLAGRTELKGFYSSCATLDNFWVWNQGPAMKRPGTRYVHPVKTKTKFARLFNFTYSTEQAYILEVGDQYMRFFTDGGIIVDPSPTPYEIVTPYLEADLPLLKFIQSADTMYITHKDYPPYKLQRFGDTNWVLTKVAFVWPPFMNANKTATTLSFSAITGSGITVTASADVFTADNVGGHYKVSGSKILEGTLVNLNDFTTSVTAKVGEKIIFNLSGTWVGTVYLQRSYDGGSTWLDYLAYTTNTSQEIFPLEDDTLYRALYFAKTSGSVLVRFTISDQAGYFLITAFATAQSVTADVIEDLPAVAATPTTAWSEGHWSDRRGYPGSAIFYEQRLVMAGTSFAPDTIFGSRIDDFEDHNPGLGADDDAYIYTLADEQVNVIKWMIGSKVLNIGTGGSEWKFGSPSVATTPTNVVANSEKHYGSSEVRGVKALDMVMYIQRGGETLRGLAINEQTTDVTLVSVNLSAQADHLLTGGVRELAWMLQPSPMLHMIKENGGVVTCAYDPEFQVRAFSTFTTDGSVESGAVIPGPKVDELWMIVAREIDGTTEKYVEYTEDPRYSTSEDQFFVDCGIEYSGAATDTIGGLDHLEGKTVNILADGAVHPEREVSGGSISLQSEIEHAIVGLPYTGTIKTQRAEGGLQTGTSQGRRKSTYKATVRLEKTVGLKVGGDTGKTDIVKFRSTTMHMDAPVDPFTGDKEIEIRDRGSWDGRIVIEHDYPTSCTVVSIMPIIKSTRL